MAEAVYKKFVGLRNDVSAERFGPEDLAIADNCQLDATGKLSRRAGRTLKLSGNFHALWSDGTQTLVVQDSNLLRINADYTTTLLRSGLTAGLRMAYSAINGQVYYSNGLQTGVIENGASRSWGIDPPTWQPAAAVTVGKMFAGVYQFAMVFLRADGQQSGTGLAESVTVPADGGGIAFSQIPVSADPGVVGKAIYLSTANGDVLYRALTLANAATSVTYANDGTDLQSPLDTQFLQDAPASHIIAYYRGLLYVAVENLLFYSEPFGLELFDLRKFFAFSSKIAIVAPVEDGLYVATENETVFLPGRNPDELTRIKKADYGGLPGTLAYAPSKLVDKNGSASDPPVAIWLSPRGVITAMNGGVLRDMTEGHYTFTTPGNGAAIFLNGNKQYIAS